MDQISRLLGFQMKRFRRRLRLRLRKGGVAGHRRKTDAVIRLLRGEDIDSLSREYGVTAATVSGWRDHFLAGGQAALKAREADERDEEVHRLKAKIGDQTMEIELLREEQRRLKQNLPLASRRSRT